MPNPVQGRALDANSHVNFLRYFMSHKVSAEVKLHLSRQSQKQYSFSHWEITGENMEMGSHEFYQNENASRFISVFFSDWRDNKTEGLPMMTTIAWPLGKHLIKQKQHEQAINF